MNNAKINNELSLNYPESFGPMSEEELVRHFGSAENRWGVFDTARHAILSVSWSKIGFFRSFTDAESYLIDVESRLRRRLLNYQRVTLIDTKVASKKVKGVRFEYRVNDSVNIHIADIIALKYKKKFYLISLITRMNNAGAVRREFREVLDSVTLG